MREIKGEIEVTKLDSFEMGCPTVTTRNWQLSQTGRNETFVYCLR